MKGTLNCRGAYLAESIGYNTTGATNDTAQSVKPPSKKQSVLNRLLGEEKQDGEFNFQDEVKSYLQEHPIKRKDNLYWWKVKQSISLP